MGTEGRAGNGGEARRAGEGPKGFPRVPGQALIPPVLREAAGETGVVRAFCLPEHQTRRGSAVGCRSPGEVVRRRHIVARRSPTRPRSAGVSHPRQNERRQGRCCPPFLPNPARKKRPPAYLEEAQNGRNSPGRAGLGNAAGGVGVANPTRQGSFPRLCIR